jgi:hypothetical protein
VTVLQEFALSQPGKCAESTASRARDTLGLLRRRPEPDVAASLLIEAGLLRRHDPLPLLRIGRSMSEFDPSLEAAAEVSWPTRLAGTHTSSNTRLHSRSNGLPVSRLM